MKTPLSKFAQAVQDLVDNENRRRKTEYINESIVIPEIHTREVYENMHLWPNRERYIFTKKELDLAEAHETGFIKMIDYAPYKKISFHLQKP